MTLCDVKDCELLATRVLTIDDYQGYGPRYVRACAIHAEPQAGIDILASDAVEVPYNTHLSAHPFGPRY